MMGHMMGFCKDLKCELDNQGDSLVITIKGEADKIAKLERKINARKELCCGDGEGESCCS